MVLLVMVVTQILLVDGDIGEVTMMVISVVGLEMVMVVLVLQI